MGEPDKTNIRLEKFTEGVIAGKSMYQAAIDAGYSKSYARNPSKALAPNMRELFRKVLEHHAPIGKLTKRIAEGLDAEETKFFQKDGIVTDGRNVIAWSERREAAALASRLLGVMPDRLEVTGEDGGQIQVAIRDVGSNG